MLAASGAAGARHEARPTPAAVEAPKPEQSSSPSSADAQAPARPGVASLAPLGEDQRRLLLQGPEDPPIEVETHYIQSNETRHDLYFPYIEGIAGAFIGVGSDQNYTMAAHARADLMILMDIDTRVVDLHRMYEVFIKGARTPDELIARWDGANEDAGLVELQAGLAGRDVIEIQRILRGYKNGRETVFRHLKRVVARRREGTPTTWLSSPERYDHIRALYQAGRVRIMVGNLAGEASMKTAGSAAAALGIPVRVLYFSNAEEYFKYGKPFVTSVRGLGADAQSVVLRTIYSMAWEHADLWAYQVQPLQDFQARLLDPRNRSRNPMLRYAKIEGAIDADPGIEGLTVVALADAPAP